MAQEQNGEPAASAPGPSDLNPKLPPPPAWEDYWAHQVAEKAKGKVLGYFGALAALVSLLITLYGVNGITTLLEDKFENVVAEKQKEATARIDCQLKEFEEKKLKSFALKLEALESEAQQRKEEYIAKLVFPPKSHDAAAFLQIRSVDLSAEIGPIRNQGGEGSAVGYSVAYALQAAIKRRDGAAVPLLSARSIYLQAKKYDRWPGEAYEGTSLEGALKAVKTLGAYWEADWPSAARSTNTSAKTGAMPAYKIANYKALQGLQEIKEALLARQVVMMTVHVTEDFNGPDKKGRIVVRVPIKGVGLHMLTIVGYNSETAEFKFANTWGSSWGLGGFAYIRDVDLQNILVSAYTLIL